MGPSAPSTVLRLSPTVSCKGPGQGSAKEATHVAAAGGAGIIKVKEGDGEATARVGGVAEGPGCGAGEGGLDGEVETVVSGVAPPEVSSSSLDSSSSRRVFTEELLKQGMGASRRPPSRVFDAGSATQNMHHRPKDTELQSKLTWSEPAGFTLIQIGRDVLSYFMQSHPHYVLETGATGGCDIDNGSPEPVLC